MLKKVQSTQAFVSSFEKIYSRRRDFFGEETSRRTFVQTKVRWEKLRFCRGVMAIVYDGNGGDRTHHLMVETIPLLTSTMQRLRRRKGGRNLV